MVGVSTGRLLTAAVIATCLCISPLMGYPGGDGSPGNPYTIATKTDLLQLAATTTDYGKCFILTSDIDLTDEVFTTAVIAPDTDPATSDFQGTAFTGVFDGGSHRVSHLTIDDGGAGNDCLALFGCSGGTIRNLTVADCSVTGSSGTFLAASLVAAVNAGGTVTNCSSSGAVTGGTRVAGLVARIYPGTMTMCFSQANVVASGEHVAGLLATNGAGSAVSQCYSTGAASGSGYIAGLVSYNAGAIDNSYARGAASASGGYVGGLVATNLGSIAKCYSTGLVTGSSNTGGLVGYVSGGTTTASFWDTETSGKSTSPQGIGKTTSQMMTLTTFTSAGWDFVEESVNGTANYWMMPEGGGYPVLTFGLLPRLEVSLNAISFIRHWGGPEPADQSVVIWNSGPGLLEWEATESCPWLEVSPASGQCSAEGDVVTIHVDTSGLGRGVYSTDITVTAAGDSKTIHVTLSIGANIVVPQDYATIQAAINAAIDGDVVTLLPGTYTGTGNVNLGFSGKAITVRSTDVDDPAVVAATVINGFGQRIFSFTSGEGSDSVVGGLTIWGGGAYTSSPYGRAILCQNSSPSIVNCVIGGGIAGVTAFALGLSNSATTLTGCTFFSNSGSVYVSGGAPVIDRCIFHDNTVSTDKGAAVECVGGNACMKNCYLSRNVGGTGTLNWAVHVSGGTLRLANCTLKDNGKIVGESGSYLCLWNTIMMPAGDSNRIRLAGNSTADIDWCAITSLTANASVEAGSVLNWGAGNIDPGIFQPMGASGHIDAGSIFMNAGDPSYSAVKGETDLEGNGRVSGGRIDIGCCEVPALPVVTRPVTGEVLAAGSERTIEWVSSAASVDLYYSTDSGANWVSIAGGEPGVGSFRWLVPDANCSGCKVAAVAGYGSTTLSGESGLFSIRPYAAGVPTCPLWSSIGGGYDRRGLSASAGPEVGCVKWALETGEPLSGSVVVGEDGRIYVASDSGWLFAANSGGELLWQLDLGSEVTSSPSLGLDGTIYVGCVDGWLIAAGSDGHVKWSIKTGDVITGSAAVGSDGRVFVASGDGSVYCLAQDGSNLWEFSAVSSMNARGFMASPTLGADGSIYVADSHKAVLYALDPNDGTVRWEADFSTERLGLNASGVLVPIITGRLTAAPAVGPDGTIYLMFEGYTKLYAVNPDGTRKWSVELADISSGLFELVNPLYPTTASLGYFVIGSAWSEAVIGPDGTVYVNMDDPHLRAVDPNGTLKWAMRVGLQGGFTMTVGADGLIYACSDDGGLYVVTPTGMTASLFDGEGWLSYPVIAEDGTIYVTDSNSGVVWAIGGECEAGARRDMHRPWDMAGAHGTDFVDFARMAADWAMTTYDYKRLYTSDGSRVIHTVNYLRGDASRDAYVDIRDVAVVAAHWLDEQ